MDFGKEFFLMMHLRGLSYVLKPRRNPSRKIWLLIRLHVFFRVGVSFYGKLKKPHSMYHGMASGWRVGKPLNATVSQK